MKKSIIQKSGAALTRLVKRAELAPGIRFEAATALMRMWLMSNVNVLVREEDGMLALLDLCRASLEEDTSFVAAGELLVQLARLVEQLPLCVHFFLLL